MPVYNSRDYLDEAISSVLQQTETDFELIIVDDGSDKDVASRLDSYADADARIVLLHTKNAGPSSARNIGLANASGEFIAFIDSDDIMAPRLLEIAIQAAEENSCDCVRFERVDLRQGNFAREVPVLPAGSITGPDGIVRLIFDMSAQREAPFVWKHLFRRAALTGVLFPTDCSFGEDLIFLVKAFAQIGTLYNLPEPLYVYRLSEGSLTRDPSKTQKNLVGMGEVSARVVELMRGFEGASEHDVANIAGARVLAILRSHIRKISSGEITRAGYLKLWADLTERGYLEVLLSAKPSLPNSASILLRLIQVGDASMFWLLARFSSAVIVPRDYLKSLRERKRFSSDDHEAAEWTSFAA